MEKEKTLFDTLLGLYLKMCYSKADNEIWKGVKIKLEEWSDLPAIQDKIYRYSDFMDELKVVLSTFYKADVELQVKKAQQDYEEYSGGVYVVKTQLTTRWGYLKNITDVTD